MFAFLTKCVRGAAIVTAAAFSLSLIAYGGSIAGASIARSGSTVPSTPVIIGQPLSPPKVPQLAVFVAENLGYFEKVHLTVTIAYMPTGLATELGTTSGSITLGMAAGSDSIEAAAEGAPIHAVWVDYRPLDTVCIARKTIKTIKDLVGKNVGSTGAGGFAATTMGACLEAGGVSANQVHEITMTRAEFVPALASGRIAAAVFHADTAYTILHTVPGAHIIDTEYKSLRTYWYGSFNVKDAYAKAHPQVVEDAIAAMMAADRWMMNPHNNGAFVQLAMRVTGESRAAVQYAINFDRSIKLWDTGCLVPSKSEPYTAKILLQQKSITRIPPFSAVYDGRYCGPAERIATTLYR